MRMTSFRIKNFRSIVDSGEITSQDLMVFIGRNNAGKSNVLKTLNAFFTNKVTSEDIPSDRTKGEIELTITFTDLDPVVRRQLSLILLNNTLPSFDEAATPESQQRTIQFETQEKPQMFPL